MRRRPAERARGAPRLRAPRAKLRLRAPRTPRPRFRAPALRGAHGQATLEALALIPLSVALGLALMQLLAIGYAGVLAGSAAEAGALAIARGEDPSAEARRALPGWSAAGARVDVDRGTVRVHLRPPSPLRALARRLEVTATAAVEAP